MKKIVFAVVTIALLAIPLASWAAEDGAALYKTKCSVCHKPGGEGVADKYPALKGTKDTAEKIADVVVKGGLTKAPHIKPVAGVTAEQAKAIADFVKAMK
jgi:mono/diheme cytochrome c family protein